MDNAYVTIDLDEHEAEQIRDWLEEQPIASGLGNLYDRLIEAIDEKEEEDSK